MNNETLLGKKVRGERKKVKQKENRIERMK